MKKPVLILVPLILLTFSCMREVEKSRLLEYKINGQDHSYSGYACRYSFYKGGIKKAFGWKFYDKIDDTLTIQAYDSTLTKNIYDFPAVRATYDVKQDAGGSKTYQATEGELKLLGLEMGDIIADFHFKVKNKIDPEDSIMILDGYIRINLDYQDSVIAR